LVVALALILPAFALRVATAAWPFFDNAWLSLHRSNPMLGPDRFIGLDNYRRLIDSPPFREAFHFTLIYTVASTIAEIILGLAIALLLNARLRLQMVGRALVLVPWAIPVVVTGIAFRFGLDPHFGLFADLIGRLTGLEVGWLLDRWPARLSVIGTNVWRNAPFVAIILLAALQAVPDDILEAARIDGAGPLQSFWTITLPIISPVIISIGVFFLIWQVSSFDLILAMTGGGPGNATQVVGYMAYLDAFQSLNFGRSAAMSMVLLAIVAMTGLLGLALLRRVEARLH
jgi:multiple sugar transport system permease protein